MITESMIVYLAVVLLVSYLARGLYDETLLEK